MAEAVTRLAVGERAQQCGDVGPSLDVGATGEVQVAQRRLGLSCESLAQVGRGAAALELGHHRELSHVGAAMARLSES